MLYDNEPTRRKSSVDLNNSLNRMQKSGSTTRSTSSNGTNNTRRNKSRWDQPETSHSTGSLLSSMERFVQTVDDMNETILVPCRLMDLQFDETFVPPPPVEKPAVMPLAMNGFGSGTTVAAGSKRDGDRILSNLNGVDLYQFYSVLNNIKNDLMWGRKQTAIPIQPGMPMNMMNMNSGGGTMLSNSSSAASVISTVSSSMLTSTSGSSSSSTSSNSNASLSQVPGNVGGGGDHNGVVVGNGSGSSSGHAKGHARRPSTVSTTSSTSASDTEFSELNEDSGVEVEHEDDCAQSVADAFHHHLSGLQQCLCDLTIASEYVTNRYNNALGGL